MATYRELTLTEFLNKPHEQFLVPIYQRDYSWEAANINRLIDDLIDFYNGEAAKSTDARYFLGTVITQPQPQNDEDLELTDIVDGQQRITTILLMLIALHAMDKEANASLKQYFTIGKDQKLKIDRIKDGDILRNVAENRLKSLTTENKHSKLYKAWQLIEKRFKELSKKDADIATKMRKAIEKTIIFNARLNEREDASKSYETLNSAGVPLKDSDLIKNKIMSFAHRWDQETTNRIQQRYDLGISVNVEESESDHFYRQFCAIHSEKHELPSLSSGKNKGKIYESFKDSFEGFQYEDPQQVENLIEQLIDVAELWRLATAGEVRDESDREIFSIAKNDYVTQDMHVIVKATRGTYFSLFAQFLLEFGWTDNPKNVVEAMRLVARSYVANLLIEQSEKNITRAVPKVFEAYKKQGVYTLNSISGFKEWSLEKLENTMKLPTVPEIIARAKTKNHYSKKTGIKRVMWLYEHILKSVKVDSAVAEVERVLPDKYQPWFAGKEITPDRREKLDVAKNTIGNLTFLTKEENIKVSNKPFEVKMKTLKESGYASNRHFQYLNEWDEKAIDARTAEITEKLMIFLTA